MWQEATVVFGLYAVGSIFFSHFETATPRWKKLLKLALFLGITAGLYSTVGRPWSFLWLLAPGLLVLYIHTVWLPRNGINGWTGEPREKYYALRGWTK